MSDNTFPVTIEQDGDTHTLSITVGQIEQRTEPDGFGGTRAGLEARIDLLAPGAEKPVVFFLSRLTGEPEWIIDAKFGPNGFPYFSHGFGSRVTVATTVIPEIADLLDDVARGRGIVRHIGRGVPLNLSS
ncbi:hypothetical protein OHA69_40680 [Streptomyces anulatus]|uniref:hypothetical protein n=1 Tax=Streptomyces anulatus TaxID=1892 RepID=UPI0022520A00|nr:hypothetical protein [Streptomyces anulatus]MCX4523906.1 hypothetical protein [Streptomyces anulatus]WSU78922.1 hypothetical protein OG499_38820 [Streptomyces anulatus]